MDTKQDREDISAILARERTGNPLAEPDQIDYENADIVIAVIKNTLRDAGLPSENPISTFKEYVRRNKEKENG